MATLIPIRGADGKIAELRPASDFRSLLDETLSAVGASPAAPAETEEEQGAQQQTSDAPDAPAAPQTRQETRRRARTLVPLHVSPRVALILGAGVLSVLLVLLLFRIEPAPPATVATSVPVATHVATTRPTTVATSVPTAVATAATGATLSHAVVAWAAPDGVVLGALDAGRSYTIVARSGADWLQLDVPASGLVWVRASDLGIVVPSSVRDLATATPAPLPTIVPVVATSIPIVATIAPPTEVPTATPRCNSKGICGRPSG